MKNLNLSEIPSSVYRLQLCQAFPFKKAIETLPYLKALGIEGIYTSPFYQAFSEHGYDVTNPNRFNPLLGTVEEFEAFCQRAKELNLFLIIDVVPNHMGFKGGGNTWWQAVLENGPYSASADFFDIDWNREGALKNRVLLPILNGFYSEVLERSEITLSYEQGAFQLSYQDFPLPCSPESYALILSHMTLAESDPTYEEFLRLKRSFTHFPKEIGPRDAIKEKELQALQALVQKPSFKSALDSVIALFNGRMGEPCSFDLLDTLLEAQYYRLSFWKVANHEINYRRFFNIQDLVALRIEDEKVLEAHHKWIYQLVDEGKVQGLRIDHPDGLYDPAGYLASLRERTSLYTVVEKILDGDEKLPSNWQVEGSVGYEFLNLLNGTFVQSENASTFDQVYRSFIQEEIDYKALLYHSKKLFALVEMVSEIEALGSKLSVIAGEMRAYRNFSLLDLTRALAETIACFPVYRTYISPKGEVSSRDEAYISSSVEKARFKAHSLESELFDFVEKALLLKLPLSEERQDALIEFVLRFQQLSGPIMAKGLEDTAFYVFNRLISLNEVGGDPIHFGTSIEAFHAFNLDKKEQWPFGFLASTTHDTKRSEDVRARLNVLSEMPGEWEQRLQEWSSLNQKYKKEDAPSLNTEYFLYQTLLGVWPKKNPQDREALFNRLWEVILKSLREAKQESSWRAPNTAYEEGVKHFLLAILDEKSAFLSSFLPFHQKINAFGEFNSLSALLLKCASCGVVDLYQGNEMWDYSLVDPDNRRPVDYAIRQSLLNGLEKGELETLKLFITKEALSFRREHKALFLEGDYLPLEVVGEKKEHVIAFLRRYKKEMLLCIASRFHYTLAKGEEYHSKMWGDTKVLLPKDVKMTSFKALFSKEKSALHDRHFSLSEGLNALPFGYFYAKAD